MKLPLLAVGLCFAGVSLAQAPDVTRMLDRLDKLEQENEKLREELKSLRAELSALKTVEEKADIQEKRVEEQAQTKVEASQKFPIQITGMMLFNVYRNGTHSGGNDVSTTASLARGRSVAGASFRQTVLGLKYHGPQTFAGGKVSGNFYMDFYDGALDSGTNTARIRTASLDIDWKTRSLMFGLEKAIFNPREPNSLMQVGVSPLTSAGNLWRWQPQVRFEQRVNFDSTTTLKAQLGVLQTNEDSSVPAGSIPSLQRRRPGAEGRFLLSKQFSEERFIEIAPGFHFSESRTGTGRAASQIFSFDWAAAPWEKLQLTGVFFNGQNVHHFGALRQGFRVLSNGSLLPIESVGGWSQLSYIATDRVTFNVYAGLHDDRNSQLLNGAVGRNNAGSANIMYKLAPNVIMSFEAMQTRTAYIGSGYRKNNRYDLAVAYLF